MAFYPPDVGNWGLTGVANVLVFALMEVLSLILFELFFRRIFAFLPMYQLAFVLETQVYWIQGRLWVITLSQMQFELVHSGKVFTCILYCQLSYFSFSNGYLIVLHKQELITHVGSNGSMTTVIEQL